MDLTKNDVKSIMWLKDANKVKWKDLQDNCPTSYALWHKMLNDYGIAHTQDVTCRDVYAKIDGWQKLQGHN